MTNALKGHWEVGHRNDGTPVVTFEARDICTVETAFGDGEEIAAAIAMLPGLLGTQGGGGQGKRPLGCPHCLGRDISHAGQAHIESGEWDAGRKEYETDGRADAYQCQVCGAEFYVWEGNDYAKV